MKNFSKLSGNLTRACRRQAQVPLLLIAIVTIIGFSMIACDDGSDKGGGKGGNGAVITVDELPEFPSGSTPAGTKTNAEKILAELRETGIIDSIRREIWEADEEFGNDSGNYSFSNKTFGSVKVSASLSSNETNTGGYKTLSDNRKARNKLENAIDELYDADSIDWTEIERLETEMDKLYEARNDIQFAVGNKSSGTWNHNFKGELTTAKTEGNVTVAQGSTYESKSNENWNDTVSKAGKFMLLRYNSTYYYKEHTMEAWTITTFSGSVKVILDATYEYNFTCKNASYDDEDDAGTEIATRKLSGSLKVYGSNNALLIDHQIKDMASYDVAYYMISYDPYTLNTADAIPLTNNNKVTGTISSEDLVALYSINVTAGTKYHIWWDDVDTSYDDYMNVMVRGYNNDGNVFFNMDADWDLDWVNYHSFTAASTGKVYIMVYPNYNNEEDSGSFAIAYNTTGSKPAFSVSFTSPSGANSGSLRNITDSVGIPKKFTQRFR